MNPLIRRRGLVFTVAALASLGALAQTVVRCGNAYGETACPGGTVVPAADPRSPGQRAQADAVIARDARMAQAMEAARLRGEAQAQAAPPAATGRATPKEHDPSSSAKNRPARIFKASAAPSRSGGAARRDKTSKKDAAPTSQANGNANQHKHAAQKTGSAAQAR